jgi:hypothetical protein
LACPGAEPATTVLIIEPFGGWVAIMVNGAQLVLLTIEIIDSNIIAPCHTLQTPIVIILEGGIELAWSLDTATETDATEQPPIFGWIVIEP